ncbi:MAG: hypothetical protein PUE01_03675, partial [Clostridiaceae bacterium]|nr:hypothetical protein [Clostridiaceae bacterium]
GVGSLIEVSDWSLSISRIIDGVNTYNEEHPNNKIVFNPNESIGKFTDEIGQTTPQKLSNKENKSVEVPIFNFKDNLLNELSSGAWAIRVGDAYVNKAKIVLPPDKAVKWFYKGKNYSATTFVLTQSGLYMAYDPTKSQAYNFEIAKSISNSDTEVSDRGAFAYFKYDDGEFIPVNSNVKDSNTGVYFLDESDLMAAMGNVKVVVKDDGGNEQKYLVTKKGFLVREEDAAVRSPYNKNYIYSRSSDEYIPTYIPTYDSNGKIISLSETREYPGVLIETTTGQFLTGESNVEYDFYYDESNNMFVSDYYINDINSYLHNTISKGCHERVGEIAGAKNASRGVNIVLQEGQFIESFDVDDGKLIPKTDAAKVLLREISEEANQGNDDLKTKTENDSDSILFYINGYLLNTV